MSPSTHIDAIVVGGGADVSDPNAQSTEPLPELVAEEPPRRKLAGYAFAPLLYVLRKTMSTRFRGIDGARDELELELLERARTLGMPVLGICRGAQLMNVQAGGTLLRDLSGYYTEMPQPWTPFPRKRVQIDPQSRLFSVLGCSDCAVNSLHRHAVDELGASLRVVAREPNGVVQAIEDPSRPFWIGVQWHPEYMPQVRPQIALFEGLVQAAKQWHEGERASVSDAAQP